MQVGKDTSILPLFSNLDCQYSISQLVEKTYKVALVYLRYNHRKFSRIFAESELTFEETAISAITPLFCKDSAEHGLPIIKEFNSWQPPIKTEDDALYFLNKIISVRVEQHISHLFKEQDPFFAKILDSVNYLVRKGGYKKVSYFGKKYIVHLACEEIKSKVIDQDSFEKLPCSLFQNRKTLLTDIFDCFKNETEFFPAVPLNALVIRLRDLNNNNNKISVSTNDTSTDFDIDEVVNSGLSCALEKLGDSYTSKGKLNECESKNFRLALKDMAEDLKDGGITRGLYEYLNQHITDLEKNVYQNKYHNILEYLLKVMKNTIREKLTEERL
jgi:hypothetical protein